MSTPTVDRLLHDAEQSYGGIEMAHLMADHDAAERLWAKCNGLIREALAIDPEMTDDAWTEADPAVVAIAHRAVP